MVQVRLRTCCWNCSDLLVFFLRGGKAFEGWLLLCSSFVSVLFLLNWVCWTKEHDGVVNARGAVRCIKGGVLCVRCIMGGGKAVPSAGASFAREYDSGTWWRQLTEGGPPAKTVAPSLALSRIWNIGQSKEWGHKENSTSLSGWVRTSGIVEVVVACFGQEKGFGQSFWQERGSCHLQGCQSHQGPKWWGKGFGKKKTTEDLRLLTSKVDLKAMTYMGDLGPCGQKRYYHYKSITVKNKGEIGNVSVWSLIWTNI